MSREAASPSFVSTPSPTAPRPLRCWDSHPPKWAGCLAPSAPHPTVCSTSVLVMQPRDRPALPSGQRGLLPPPLLLVVLDTEWSAHLQRPLPVPAPKHVQCEPQGACSDSQADRCPAGESPLSLYSHRRSLPPIFRSGIIRGKRAPSPTGCKSTFLGLLALCTLFCDHAETLKSPFTYRPPLVLAQICM